MSNIVHGDGISFVTTNSTATEKAKSGGPGDAKPPARTGKRGRRSTWLTHDRPAFSYEQGRLFCFMGQSDAGTGW